MRKTVCKQLRKEARIVCAMISQAKKEIAIYKTYRSLKSIHARKNRPAGTDFDYNRENARIRKKKARKKKRERAKR